MDSILPNTIPHRPLLALAPMEGITNAIFRDKVIALGGLDLVATEFVRITSEKQTIKPFERHSVPLQIQVMGNDATVISGCVKYLKEKGLLSDSDWLDLNVGCPSKKVNSKGAGAALLLDPKKIVEITESIRQSHPGKFSIKTRLGYQNDEKFPEILRALQDCPIDFITIHARARCQGYDEPVNLNRLEQAVRTLPYPVVGNGDIWKVEDAYNMWENTGVSGIMCGRGAISNPFLFDDIKSNRTEEKLGKSFLLQRRRELEQFAHDLISAYQDAEGKRLNSYVGRTKEFLLWFSKNPLVKKDLFDAIKRSKSLAEIRFAISAYFERPFQEVSNN